MSSVWRTLKGYLFWTYERGSFHYDVMVTLILAFIFLAPKFIDFRDQPPGIPARHGNAAITAYTVYEVEASQVDAQDLDMVRINCERALRPAAGAVTVERVEPVRDPSRHITAYRAWVRK
jgi:hypothetical protein